MSDEPTHTDAATPEATLDAVNIALANIGARPSAPEAGQALAKRVPLLLPASAVPAEYFQSISACAEQCFREFASRHELFNHGGALVELRADETPDTQRRLSLHPVIADGFRSRVERHFLPMSYRAVGHGGYDLKHVTVTKDLAQAMLASREMQALLPPIIGIADAPILLADGRIIPPGYDRQTGWLVTGGHADTDIDHADAARLLASLLDGFDFPTAGDRARALAAFFAPALRFGRFFLRVPIDGAEADDSQSGKTYRIIVVGGIYGAEPSVITQRDGGVGSLDETFASRLHQGRSFILFDNLRGRINSMYLEAYMTAQGRTFPVRVPHAGLVDIDPSGHTIALSSNGVETTRDLANRCCIIRIRKRSAGYQYPLFDGLPLLAYVQQHQGRVLGAIYAILKDWIAAGKPASADGGHDFREWAAATDYIVRHYFGTGPLMEGHDEAKVRVSDPGLSLVRRLALAVAQDGRLAQEFSATDLFQLCDDHGLDIPGLRDRTEEAGRKRIGAVMRHAGLKEAGQVVWVDGYAIERRDRSVRRPDGEGFFPQAVYSVTRSEDETASTAETTVSPVRSTENPPFSSKDVPLTAATAVTAVSPQPALPLPPATMEPTP